MITDTNTNTRIDEIAANLYRISVPLTGPIPGGFSFNHFLFAGDQPLLFHSGYSAMFDLVRTAIATVLPPEQLRYVGYSHYEPDESGAVDQFLSIAPHAQPFSSEIGVMVSLGGPFQRPSLPLSDGQILDIGSHRLQWMATPHFPHGWDCGILFDHTTQTLLSGDLFTHGGDNNPPVTETEILTASEQFRVMMDYFAHAPNPGEQVEKLAALNPKLLACQHGSSYRGDGAALLRGLAGILGGDSVR